MGITIVMKFGTRLRAGRFDKQANPISRMGVLVFGLIVWPIQPGYMALILQDGGNLGITQDDFNTLLDLTIQNNDNETTYDSAQIDLDLILGNVADYISVNSINPTYAGQTRDTIMSNWGATVRAPPSGEVYTGWSDTIDGNNDLNLTNNGGSRPSDYTRWTDTTQNSGNQDLMAITLDLNDSLDLNNNGQYDAATESLILTTSSVSAFEATLSGGSTIPGSMNSYAVIPEPSALWLCGAALLAGLAVRGFRVARG